MSSYGISLSPVTQKFVDRGEKERILYVLHMHISLVSKLRCYKITMGDQLVSTHYKLLYHSNRLTTHSLYNLQTRGKLTLVYKELSRNSIRYLRSLGTWH